MVRFRLSTVVTLTVLVVFLLTLFTINRLMQRMSKRDARVSQDHPIDSSGTCSHIKIEGSI